MKFKHSLLIFAVCSGLSFNMVTAVGPGSSKSENTQKAFETYFNKLKTFDKAIEPALLESCLNAHITDETKLIIKVINRYAQLLPDIPDGEGLCVTFLVYGGMDAYNFLVSLTKFVVTWFEDCYSTHNWPKETIEKEVNELNTLWINQSSMEGILKFLELENETIPVRLYEKLRATNKNSERPTKYSGQSTHGIMKSPGTDPRSRTNGGSTSKTGENKSGSTAKPQAIVYPQSPEEYKRVDDALKGKYFAWILKPPVMQGIYKVLTELAKPGQQNQIDKAKQLTTLKELSAKAQASDCEQEVETLLRILKSNCKTGK